MDSKTWTILKILQWTVDYFVSHQIENSRLDAEILLAKVLGLTRVQLYTRFDQPLQDEELKNYKAFIQRRIKREPLAYIVGSKEFYSRDFIVTSDVLIPRPETEMLIDEAISFAKDRETLQMVDLGTGSGCIAITLALEIPNSLVWAIDFSEKALEITKKNVEKYQLQERVRIIYADILKQEWSKEISPFDLIVSNPPYISSGEIEKLTPEIQFEPRAALDGGKEGFDYYETMIPSSFLHLKKGGIALFEIGFDQEKKIRELLEKTGNDNFEIKLDLAGHPRVVRIMNGSFAD